MVTFLTTLTLSSSSIITAQSSSSSHSDEISSIPAADALYSSPKPLVVEDEDHSSTRRLVNNDTDDEDYVSPKPLMGWSPWNYFLRNWTESNYHDAVNQLKALGLKDSGYDWILMTGGWWKGFGKGRVVRDKRGRILSNPKVFTISRTVDAFIKWVHSEGFRYGHYTNAGKVYLHTLSYSLSLSSRNPD